MTTMPIISSRLNSMKVRPDLWNRSIAPEDLIARLATVEGVGGIDLNYPQHVDVSSVVHMRDVIEANGLRPTAVNVRYDEGFVRGGFTSQDAIIRQNALDFTCRAADIARELGCHEIVIWPSYDGFDYPFQLDYAHAWFHTIEALQALSDRLPDIRIGIEYKPGEPRRFSLLGNAGMTLAAIEQAGRDNLGITVDFAHALMAGENPACIARIAAASGRLVGVHLNDAYGRADDGLVVGAIHERQTLELLWHLQQVDYTGHLYFDTFPTIEDPTRELELNIRTLKYLWSTASALDSAAVQSAMVSHDPTEAIALLAPTRLAQ